MTYALVFLTIAYALLAAYVLTRTEKRWYFLDEKTPVEFTSIMNYPVALFGEEFGVIVDQAEYHPHGPAKWVTVPHGEPCYPYAWFDLPSPPPPDETHYRGLGPAVRDYI